MSNRRPDCLESDAAKWLRAQCANPDFIELLALFDAMEWEIRVHRKTAYVDAGRTHEQGVCPCCGHKLGDVK
jgi:hypothetical protein